MCEYNVKEFDFFAELSELTLIYQTGIMETYSKAITITKER